MGNSIFGNVIFNRKSHEMKELLNDGRWEERDTEYYIYDEIFEEEVSVNKCTGVVSHYGFNGLVYDYIERGIFIIS